MRKNLRLFLSSNSVYKDMNYLEHTIEDMLNFLGKGIGQIIFIPFAAVSEPTKLNKTWYEYSRMPAEVFKKYGIEVLALHAFGSEERMQDAINTSQAVFIGGGNTHQLLHWLKRLELIKLLQHALKYGVPMIGSSAGTNVFCPTISTTNDMPICSLPDLNSIGAVSFQINPHYIDSDQNSEHRGETRDERIIEYIKLSGNQVVGLREGSWLRIENGKILLKGLAGAKLFKKFGESRLLEPSKEGLDITPLLVEKGKS